MKRGNINARFLSEAKRSVSKRYKSFSKPILAHKNDQNLITLDGITSLLSNIDEDALAGRIEAKLTLDLVGLSTFNYHISSN